MSSRDHRAGHKASSGRNARWRRIVVLGAAIGFLAATGYLASSLLLPAGGAPKLVVDRTVIDFGDVSYGRFVTAEFMLSNAGAGALRITDGPVVKVLQGC
jgi:hypothetical protein